MAAALVCTDRDDFRRRVREQRSLHWRNNSRAPHQRGHSMTSPADSSTEIESPGSDGQRMSENPWQLWAMIDAITVLQTHFANRPAHATASARRNPMGVAVINWRSRFRKILSEKEQRVRSTKRERPSSTMSHAPVTIIRTRIDRGRWTPALDEALTQRIAPGSSNVSVRNASAAVLRLGACSACATTASRVSRAPGSRAARQAVGQQAEGGVAFGAVPASDSVFRARS